MEWVSQVIIQGVAAGAVFLCACSLLWMLGFSFEDFAARLCIAKPLVLCLDARKDGGGRGRLRAWSKSSVRRWKALREAFWQTETDEGERVRAVRKAVCSLEPAASAEEATTEEWLGRWLALYGPLFGHRIMLPSRMCAALGMAMSAAAITCVAKVVTYLAVASRGIAISAVAGSLVIASLLLPLQRHGARLSLFSAVWKAAMLWCVPFFVFQILKRVLSLADPAKTMDAVVVMAVATALLNSPSEEGSGSFDDRRIVFVQMGASGAAFFLSTVVAADVVLEYVAFSVALMVYEESRGVKAAEAAGDDGDERARKIGRWGGYQVVLTREGSLEEKAWRLFRRGSNMTDQQNMTGNQQDTVPPVDGGDDTVAVGLLSQELGGVSVEWAGGRVRAVGVVGRQQVGKTTTLNGVFGTRFATGNRAAQVTKGIQLCALQRDGGTGVLVLDAEGCGSPERQMGMLENTDPPVAQERVLEREFQMLVHMGAVCEAMLFVLFRAETLANSDLLVRVAKAIAVIPDEQELKCRRLFLVATGFGNKEVAERECREVLKRAKERAPAVAADILDRAVVCSLRSPEMDPTGWRQDVARLRAALVDLVIEEWHGADGDAPTVDEWRRAAAVGFRASQKANGRSEVEEHARSCFVACRANQARHVHAVAELQQLPSLRSGAEQFSVTIKHGLSGHTVANMQCGSQTKVWQLPFSWEIQRLMLGTRELGDEETMGDVGVADGAVLYAFDRTQCSCCLRPALPFYRPWSPQPRLECNRFPQEVATLKSAYPGWRFSCSSRFRFVCMEFPVPAWNNEQATLVWDLLSYPHRPPRCSLIAPDKTLDGPSHFVDGVFSKRSPILENWMPTRQLREVVELVVGSFEKFSGEECCHSAILARAPRKLNAPMTAYWQELTAALQ